MKVCKIAVVFLVAFLFLGMKGDKNSIYHNGWIDFNKNGVKDVFEDSEAPLETRVQNLISLMNVNEKTCQLATLYGFARVLEDEMPNEKWKKRVWKDGIAQYRRTP